MPPSAGVALVNPKLPHNVGYVLRACSNFGAQSLVWSPERIEHPDRWPKGSRLPREERMRLYRDVRVATRPQHALLDEPNATPVAVEVRANAEPLPTFEHPENALYVFGPEDGTLGRAILAACHRFVVIPSTSCLNLAAAVNVVLYDRVSKTGPAFVPRTEPAYPAVDG